MNIGNGPVAITFDVSGTTGLPSCDIRGFSCPFGQTCLLADANGRTFCAAAGTLPPGSPCTSEQCQAGSQCLNLDPDHPDQGTCAQFCDTSISTFGCNCQGLGISNSNAGFCGPPMNAGSSRKQWRSRSTLLKSAARCAEDSVNTVSPFSRRYSLVFR